MIKNKDGTNLYPCYYCGKYTNLRDTKGLPVNNLIDNS